MKLYNYIITGTAVIGIIGGMFLISQNDIEGHVKAQEDIFYPLETVVETTVTQIPESVIASEIETSTYTSVEMEYLETTTETSEMLETTEVCENSETSETSEHVCQVENENEISDLFKFIASWENSDLYKYEYEEVFNDFTEITDYITPNKNYYIVTRDVFGALNIGYGICIYTDDIGYMNVDKFAQFNIDISKVEEGDTISAEIVRCVHKSIIDDMYTAVTKKLQENGVYLTNTQINALTSIAYQFGLNGANIDTFCDLYKKYGNTEELRNTYQTLGGTYPFKHVLGGQNLDGYTRADANWHLFSTSTYIYGD